MGYTKHMLNKIKEIVSHIYQDVLTENLKLKAQNRRLRNKLNNYRLTVKSYNIGILRKNATILALKKHLPEAVDKNVHKIERKAAQ